MEIDGTALDTASGQCVCPRNTYDVRRTGVLLYATGGRFDGFGEL